MISGLAAGLAIQSGHDANIACAGKSSSALSKWIIATKRRKGGNDKADEEALGLCARHG
jgi:hypothetical protein